MVVGDDPPGHAELAGPARPRRCVDRHGDSGRPEFRQSADPHRRSCRNANGVAIPVDNPGNLLTLQYVNVVGNSAAQVKSPGQGTGGNGGGIASGTLMLVNSGVSGNSASGLNAASGHAGGVYADQGVTLVASHVHGNSVRNAGGINVFGPVNILGGSTVNGNTL